MRRDERDAAFLGSGVVLGAIAGAVGFWAFDQVAKARTVTAPKVRADRVLVTPPRVTPS